MLPQDFVKFGLIPEFVGRLPVTVALDLLDEEALVQILTKPKNSIVKQYEKLFELDGVELVFDEEAIKAVAKESVLRKTGARGLRAIMEQTMMDTMYTIPSDESVVKCTITRETVEKNQVPVIEKREDKRKRPAITQKKLKKADDESA